MLTVFRAFYINLQLISSTISIRLDLLKYSRFLGSIDGTPYKQGTKKNLSIVSGYRIQSVLYSVL